MARRTTSILLGAVVAVLVVFNVVIAFVSPHDTISNVVYEWSGQHPTVPLLLGVVFGHWFWPPRDNVLAIGPWLLLVWGAVFAAADWFGALPNIPIALAAVTGIALGGWLWGRQEH